LRKILILGTLILILFVAVFRQRLFLRDPLGKVERNGVAVDGARLYINYSNDVLVEEPGAQRRYLVQGWSGVPGLPKRLACVTGMLCWTDADQASVFPLNDNRTTTRATMNAKVVTFTDESGATVTAKLR
jgi:hypothetical protein